MSQLMREMKELYRIRHYDFMGYTFRTIDDLSYHHIKKKCDGGLRTLENGALLAKDTAHPYLHVIERLDYDIYVYINKILKDINNQQSHPTIEQLKAIRELLLLFEEEHRYDRNSDGNILVKQKFIDRRIEL